MYGKEVEAVKVCGSLMLAAPTLGERYRHYRKFVELVCGYVGQGDESRLVAVERLESLVRLQSLQSLQSDYRSVPIPDGAVVYCDPPYRGTNCGCYGGFDFDAFDAWLASCGHLCVVSEYTAPAGCVEVAARRKQCSASANGKSQRVTERLFVHESHLGEYEEAMASCRNDMGARPRPSST